MDAMKVCSEWLQTAVKRLEAARHGDKDSDADLLLDKLGSIRVMTATVPTFNHIGKLGAKMPKFSLSFCIILLSQIGNFPSLYY